MQFDFLDYNLDKQVFNTDVKKIIEKLKIQGVEGYYMHSRYNDI